jgi:hypothetical protein
MEEAELRGRDEGRKDMAKELLVHEVSPDVAAESAGLSLDTLKIDIPEGFVPKAW